MSIPPVSDAGIATGPEGGPRPATGGTKAEFCPPKDRRKDGLQTESRKPLPARLDACDSGEDNGPAARFGQPCASVRPMTQSKTSDELYNERRRRHAAELIAALVRKRRRVTTDESLLDQEALRAAADRAARREGEHAD